VGQAVFAPLRHADCKFIITPAQRMTREVIAITGATGFIGRRLLKTLAAESHVEIRALVRNGGDHKFEHPNVVVVAGDMRAPQTFERLILEESTWINLVSLNLRSESEETRLMTQLVAICRKKRVKRIVHCSTAVVVGRAPVDVVSEITECEPASTYEIRKLAVERVLLGYAEDGLEITALRPTAVFGPGGRNLIKLAHDLLHRPRLVNYLKSCVQGRRKMNLVCVANVVAALIFLATSKADVTGQPFLV
jgi:nucleoside-diphosphate-sugar epimerase